MSILLGCPKCRSILTLNGMIVLVVQKDKIRTLIGLHAEPGNYNYSLPDGVEIADGEIWDFLCPICDTNLQAEEVNRLCRLELVDRGGQPRQALFSRLAGEQATFIVSTEDLEEKYGIHANNFETELGSIRYFRY